MVEGAATRSMDLRGDGSKCFRVGVGVRPTPEPCHEDRGDAVPDLDSSWVGGDDRRNGEFSTGCVRQCRDLTFRSVRFILEKAGPHVSAQHKRTTVVKPQLMHGGGRCAGHASHTDDLGTSRPARPRSNVPGHGRTTKAGWKL
jgi:hypothetical protein